MTVVDVTFWIIAASIVTSYFIWKMIKVDQKRRKAILKMLQEEKAQIKRQIVRNIFSDLQKARIVLNEFHKDYDSKVLILFPKDLRLTNSDIIIYFDGSLQQELINLKDNYELFVRNMFDNDNNPSFSKSNNFDLGIKLLIEELDTVLNILSAEF